MNIPNRVIPLPNDTQHEASVAPVLEVDLLGQKHRQFPRGYNWLSVHLRDIDDINRGIDPNND